MRQDLAKKVFGDWYGILRPIWSSDYFRNLLDDLSKLYSDKTITIYPKQSDVFKAFRLCKYSDFKIIIWNLEPYSSSKATGLAFGNAWNSGIMSSDLCKIQETIENDYYNGLNLNFDQTLESWAKQGVLLLNMSLTIEKDKTGSHLKKWSEFTEMFFKLMSEWRPDIIHCLWGKTAQSYKKHIISGHIIEAEHPIASIYGNRQWDFSFKQIDKVTNKLYGENIKW